MSADETTSLMAEYQSGLTSALIGLLIARGVISREEFVGALSVVSNTHNDERVRGLFRALADNLLGAQPPPDDTRASLSLVIGGRLQSSPN